MFRTSIVHPQERFQAVCYKFGMWYFAYYSIRPDVMQPHIIWTYRVVRKIPHTKFATYSLKTLLRMDYWGPKHVELTSVMNKLTHKTLCILLDYIYMTVHTYVCLLQSKLLLLFSEKFCRDVENDAAWLVLSTLWTFTNSISRYGG